MILDFYGAFKVGILGSRDNFFISHFKRLIEPFGWFFGVQWYLGIIISFLGIWCLKIIKKYSGEILNIDGPTGGYNLQVAWSTGYLAGGSSFNYPQAIIEN